MRDSRDSSDWLINLAPRRRGRVNLLCLPFAGGGSSAFHTWPAGLECDVAVWTVRLPGRESRLAEAPYHDLHTLIGDLVPEVVALARRGPYAVFGHSMGALLGYELVRALRDRGAPEPVWLVASGHEAPQVPRPPGRLHLMPDERLTEALREYGATPDALLSQPELLELFLPTIRADFAVVETYTHRPGPPLSCPLAVFRGVTDAGVSASGSRAWADLTTGPCLHRSFPGGHFFVDDVRDLVLDELGRILGGTGTTHRVA